MPLSTLSEWLSWIASIHTSDIELGLDRVKKIADRLGLLSPPGKVIIVGGTNGKGSNVAGLEAIYLAAGYEVGAFTSPVLFKHNEQVRVNGKLLPDEAFCAAFATVEKARGTVLLTPFEFHTLAALCLFQDRVSFFKLKRPLDILLLEVGLGGRLDAVNIMNAAVSVITSIDLDHMEWLGETREEIGYEKAGIFRPHQPAICGDQHPPQSLLAYAAHINAPLFYQGRDFYYQEDKLTWSFASHIKNTAYHGLPKSLLATQNMSTVLMTITVLQNQLPVSREAMNQGLKRVFLPGRIQVIKKRIIKKQITEIVDVSHNPAAIRFLAEKIQGLVCHGKTHAVFSMLADKNIVESIQSIRGLIDTWHVASLQGKRAATTDMLIKAFQQAQIHDVIWHASIKEAYQTAIEQCHSGDRIIIFGSFHTVAEAEADITNPLVRPLF